MREPMRAWYSVNQAKRVETNFYRLEDGGEVEATELKRLDRSSNWDDAKDLGVVVKWLRCGQSRPDNGVMIL